IFAFECRVRAFWVSEFGQLTKSQQLIADRRPHFYSPPANRPPRAAVVDAAEGNDEGYKPQPHLHGDRVHFVMQAVPRDQRARFLHGVESGEAVTQMPEFLAQAITIKYRFVLPFK